MLHLDAFIDFEEIEVALVINNEFDGCRHWYSWQFQQFEGCFAHFLAQILELVFDERRRCFFNDF